MADRNYFRVRLGEGNKFVQQCVDEGFIGVNWGFKESFEGQFTDNWHEFNAKFIQVYLNNHPDKTKRSAGLACGMLQTICYYAQEGDIVISPDGQGSFFVGEIAGDYLFAAGQELAHRRPVQWFDKKIHQNEMSEDLWKSARVGLTAVYLNHHEDELEHLIGSHAATTPIQTTDATIEDPSHFAMEKHLEDFLVENWDTTELAKDYNIFEDDEGNGQQFPTDTGPIDILAEKKDGSELLVIELKRGRASDVVVGQIQRYMGYVMEELADEGQAVRGCIIAFEDDPKIRYALKVNPLIDFYRYEVNFKLVKGD